MVSFTEISLESNHNCAYPVLTINSQILQLFLFCILPLHKHQQLHYFRRLKKVLKGFFLYDGAPILPSVMYSK